MSEKQAEEMLDGQWCIVANIIKEHPFGPGGKETKIGTRKFRGGAKVYISGWFGGNCKKIVAVGLHRISRRFIVSVVDVKYFEDFRAKFVYKPRVLELIRNDNRCWVLTKEVAETWSKEFLVWQKIWDKS